MESIFLIIIFSAIGITFIACNPKKKTIKETKTHATNSKSYTVSDKIPIWSTTIPHAELITGTEIYNDGIAKNVSIPTIKIFSPSKENSGDAALVFSGGGYTKVAIEL